MSDTQTAVQDALIALLAADTGIQAVLGTQPRIYDHAPPETAFPFLVFGETRARRADGLAGTGFEQEWTFHVFSRYRGQREITRVLGALYDALHNKPLSVAGQSFAIALFLQAQTSLEEDGLTYHARAVYRVVTSV